MFPLQKFHGARRVLRHIDLIAVLHRRAQAVAGGLLVIDNQKHWLTHGRTKQKLSPPDAQWESAGGRKSKVQSPKSKVQSPRSKVQRFPDLSTQPLSNPRSNPLSNPLSIPQIPQGAIRQVQVQCRSTVES